MKKRGNFSKSKTKKDFVFDRHDTKHLPENNLFQSLDKKIRKPNISDFQMNPNMTDEKF